MPRNRTLLVRIKTLFTFLITIFLVASCDQPEEFSRFGRNPTALDCTAVEGSRILSQALQHAPLSEGGLPVPDVGSPLAPFKPETHIARYNYFLKMATSEGLIKVHNCGACGYPFPYQEVVDRIAEFRQEIASANINEWFPRVYTSCNTLIESNLQSRLAPE